MISFETKMRFKNKTSAGQMDPSDFLVVANAIAQVAKTNPDKRVPIEQTTANALGRLYIGDPVEVRPSSLHGNGVFAKTDLEADKVVAVYPCHGLISNGLLSTQFQYKDQMTGFDVHDYKLDLDGTGKYLVGIPSVYDGNMVGHLINDSYSSIEQLKVDLNTYDVNTFGNAMAIYAISSSKRVNCRLMTGSHFGYVKTTRPVKKGEELVCSYGFSYWTNMNAVDIVALAETYLRSLPVKEQLLLRGLVYQAGVGH
jgi:hypothetical protein